MKFHVETFKSLLFVRRVCLCSMYIGQYRIGCNEGVPNRSVSALSEGDNRVDK